MILPELALLFTYNGMPNPGIKPTRSPNPPVVNPDFPVADTEKPVPILFDSYIIEE